jgi:hypothetical protein
LSAQRMTNSSDASAGTRIRQSRLAAACHRNPKRSGDRQEEPRNSGAGEGIRTLDPDLGKVVLYH